MTQREYQTEYERIERAAVTGQMSWAAACARIAMLSIEYGQQTGFCAGPAAAAPLAVVRKSEAL